jgi:hypothetical protein
MKKRYYIYALLLSLAAPFVASCSDWTETEAESFPEEITSEEYYAALRAYKQTDHQVAFGWYSGWNAEGAFMKTSLAGIPDSMDIVSIWDNGFIVYFYYCFGLFSFKTVLKTDKRLHIKTG